MREKELVFRDYQLTTIADAYRSFGVYPAGPKDDAIVAACGGNGTGENRHHGSTSEELATGARDDDVSPLRTQPTVDPKF